MPTQSQIKTLCLFFYCLSYNYFTKNIAYIVSLVLVISNYFCKTYLKQEQDEEQKQKQEQEQEQEQEHKQEQDL